MNLLESAGFSRSNPYYIVKQGKVRVIITGEIQLPELILGKMKFLGGLNFNFVPNIKIRLLKKQTKIPLPFK